MGRKLALFGTSLVLSSATPVYTFAEQNTPGSQPVKLQDVVVTGTKEGEVDLQSVPSAITAYTSEDLEDSGIDNVEDLRLQTPGLNLTRNGQATRLYMRGIGSNLDFIGSDPSVTVHVDGVYQPRTTTVLEQFLDIERVEVLRGPQGTLYGRNSTGGTINIVSKLPEKETEAKVFAELGTYNYRSVGVVLSGAIDDSDVLGRISVMKTDHDPYVKNTNANGVDGLMDDDSISSRGTLRFLLNQGSELILRADYSDIDRMPGAYKPTGLTPAGGTAPAFGGVVQTDDPWEMNIDFIDPYVENTHWGASLEYSRSLTDNLTLVSLTGYRDLEFDTNEDTDGSNLGILMTELAEEQDQITEELRLHYTDDRLRAVGGFYYLSEDQKTQTTVNVNGAPATVLDAENEVTAYAVFGQGTYALSDHLNGTLGVRYSNEEKEFTNVNADGTGTPRYAVNLKQDWDSWSPKIGVDYTYDSGTMVYGSVSRGFKSGGFNMTAEDAEFDPEKVWSYEVGTKMELLDNKLRTNVSVFYYDYEDLQVQNFIVPGQLTIENAADATVMGFEIENHWMPTYDWLFELDYAFLDAEYDTYVLTTGDASGDDLVASPRHKINAATQFFHDTKGGSLSYRLEYAWQDDQFFTAPNQDVSRQNAYGLLNARIAYHTSDEKCEIQFYGENLGNKTYSTSSREFPAASVGITKDINPPRTFGVRYIHSF